MFSNNSTLESQQWAQHFETVRAKARTLAHNLDLNALNIYKNDVQDLGSKNIVQYEIDCLGWYEAVKKVTDNMDIPQLKNYLNERTWDEVSLQIMLDRIHAIFNYPKENFLVRKLYKIPIGDVQTRLQNVIRLAEEFLEIQKANDLLYGTINKLNQRLGIENSSECLSYPHEIVKNPSAIYTYLAEIEPLIIQLNNSRDTLKQRLLVTDKLTNRYWEEKEALLKRVSKEAGYTDFEQLIQHYIQWKGDTNLNVPAYIYDKDVYPQSNTRHMAIDHSRRIWSTTRYNYSTNFECRGLFKR